MVGTTASSEVNDHCVGPFVGSFGRRDVDDGSRGVPWNNVCLLAVRQSDC